MIEYKVSGLIKKTIFDNSITGINNKMKQTSISKSLIFRIKYQKTTVILKTTKPNAKATGIGKKANR